MSNAYFFYTQHRLELNRTVLHQKGKATDPVKYFAAPENQDLGIVKRQRKPRIKLIVVPFPEKQRGPDQFFFQASLQSS